jgi:hypothetical protein
MQSSMQKIGLRFVVASNVSFFLSFFLLCVLCDSVVSFSSDAPHWLSDWEEGGKAARASGKPLFVVFRCQH